MEFESRLIPIMREGIEVVKMIFFKELKDYLAGRHPDYDPAYTGKIAGAVLNELFGTPNTQEPFATFVQDNKETISATLALLVNEFEKMRIPLTDALRMQFLCDSMEGDEDQGLLKRAEEFGVLIVDREMPLPHHFMELVRRLGSSYGLLIKPMPKDTDAKDN